MKNDAIELQVENLGPVRKGSVRIPDKGSVTVFVGKNNTGKSYTAQMLYAILKATSIDIRYPINELKTLMKRRVAQSDLKKDVFEALCRSIEANYKAGIKQNVREIFGSIKGIVRTGSKTLVVNLRSPQMTVIITPRKTEVSWSPLGLGRTRERFEESYRPGRDPWRYVDFLLESMESLGTPVYILPAERAAFTKLLGVLLRALAVPSRTLRGPFDRDRLALRLAEREEKIPALTLDLLNTFLTTHTADVFDPELKALEAVMEGRIVENTKTLGIAYQSNKGPRVDLQAASSGVAELASLYLMVKKTLNRGNLLIFEEPEAHLHPAAQVLLARFMAAFGSERGENRFDNSQHLVAHCTCPFGRCLGFVCRRQAKDRIH